MATRKKRTSKRQSISSSRPRSYGEIYKGDRKEQPAVAPAQSQPTPRAAAAASTADWRTEYSHVLRDLRTLLIVSAILFAVIIVASFFI